MVLQPLLCPPRTLLSDREGQLQLACPSLFLLDLLALDSKL